MITENEFKKRLKEYDESYSSKNYDFRNFTFHTFIAETKVNNDIMLRFQPISSGVSLISNSKEFYAEREKNTVVGSGDFKKQHGISEKELNLIKHNGFYIEYMDKTRSEILIPTESFLSTFGSKIGMGKFLPGRGNFALARDIYAMMLIDKLPSPKKCIFTKRISRTSSIALSCFTNKKYRPFYLIYENLYKEMKKTEPELAVVGMDLNPDNTSIYFSFGDGQNGIRSGMQYSFSDTGDFSYALKPIIYLYNIPIPVDDGIKKKYSKEYNENEMLRPFIKYQHDKLIKLYMCLTNRAGGGGIQYTTTH